MKKALLVLAGLAFATAALAQLSKYKDWGKSPEAYFLTPSERGEWARIQSDADAEKFIATYWAKRDPNPATANNEFRDEVNRRIAAADEQFKLRRQRGAESARGRLLVTLGPPTRFSQQRPQDRDEPTAGATAPGIPTGTAGLGAAQVTVTWTYDKDRFDPSWGIGELRARILVDPQEGFDQLQSAGPVDRAIARVAEKSIVSSGAQAAAPPGAPPSTAPSAAAAPPGAGAPPAPTPAATTRTSPAVPSAATGTAPATSAPPAGGAGAAAAPAALPAAARAALETVLQSKKADDSGFWAGTFRSIPGEPFYALQLYLSADRAESAAAAGVKFGGVVQDASGRDVATFWEDAALIEMKTGPRTDRVYDRSVVLPPGSYRGSFGLFPAAGGEPLVSSSAQWSIAPTAGVFDVSPLILGNTLAPMTRRPAPTEPFVFGAEKPIRVEPKANKQFMQQDGLWYFYTVSNPSIPEAGAAPAPAATPAPSTTPGAAASAVIPAAAPKPRIQARISVMRDGKAAFAPFTGPAEMQPLGSGYFASGSEIPLASFEPGHYTFGLLVRDLNAPRDSPANKGIERKEDFIVLTADGKVPPKAAAAGAAAPAAKPKPTPRKP